MEKDVVDCYSAKTKEQQLLQILEKEFKQPPRVARAILQDVQECLEGQSEQVKTGQMRVILVEIAARHGEALCNTRQKEVVWTVDAGLEDYEVNRRYGVQAMRRQRIQRLLVEAVEQGTVAGQEDLARVFIG